MSAGTGENEMGLRKILDFTRMGSIAILCMHFYYECYGLFKEWKLTAAISDRILENIIKTGLFSSFIFAKTIALLLLIISMIGARGKKEEKLHLKRIITG